MWNVHNEKHVEFVSEKSYTIYSCKIVCKVWEKYEK